VFIEALFDLEMAHAIASLYLRIPIEKIVITYRELAASKMWLFFKVKI